MNKIRASPNSTIIRQLLLTFLFPSSFSDAYRFLHIVFELNFEVSKVYFHYDI